MDATSSNPSTATGTVSLSDIPSNYRFIYITHGYYDSGFPSYSSVLIPVAILSVPNKENFFYSGGIFNGAPEAVTINTFVPSSSSITITIGNCYLSGASNCYAVVYGIK